ncbi:27326_t:CDS:1, partial [Gigaspora margarita]
SMALMALIASIWMQLMIVVINYYYKYIYALLPDRSTIDINLNVLDKK